MPRFFCDKAALNLAENHAIIEGDDAKHISKVLRMRIGDKVTINDKNGYDFDCEIEEIGESVSLKIISGQENSTEPSVKITLFQCLPKGDKLDFIIQKAVELGVYRIIPVQSSFCVARADSESFGKKLSRLNKIAFEAAKQCGRGIIPQVFNIISFRDAVQMSKNIPSIIFYEGGGERVSTLISQEEKEVNIFVGSEGGFSKEEIELAVENNIHMATLGKLILRCETAPIVGVTIVLNHTQNM